VLGFLAGLPLLFRRKLGDGRYFILFWFLLWVVAFCFPGGKFTRYYTPVLPAVLITSALGIQFIGRWLASWAPGIKHYVPASLAVIVIAGSVVNSINAAPHFRLFTNSIGGGMSWAGYYFPHDEFYDASMRDAIAEIARRARPGARVASESPSLAGYYAEREKRTDLICISLSEPDAMQQLSTGDYIIIARGRRYFSNDAIISTLRDHSTPVVELKLGSVPSAKIYELSQRETQNAGTLSFDSLDARRKSDGKVPFRTPSPIPKTTTVD
jgi:hypothetical protein